MAQAASTVTNKLHSILSLPSGMPAAVSVMADLAGLQLPLFEGHQVITQNAAPEIIERTNANRYPTVHIYCSKVVNQLREKFRKFSGEVQMTVEVRISQDRLDGLENMVQIYADAVTRILDENRGSWDGGVFYGGGYEVTYGPVKHGGRNFLQMAKIGFTTEFSTN